MLLPLNDIYLDLIPANLSALPAAVPVRWDWLLYKFWGARR